MNSFVKTALSFLAALLLLSLVAGAGAYAAGSLVIGGRALVDIVPAEAIKQAVTTAFRPQTIDLLSKYAVQVADRAINLEFSTYDHVAVAYNLAVSMPEGAQIIAFETVGDRLDITGVADSRATVDAFERHLLKRGFEITHTSYAQNTDGACVFRYELPIPKSGLSIP